MSQAKLFLILLINAFCGMQAVASTSFTMVGAGRTFAESEKIAEHDAHEVCLHPARQNEWKLSRSAGSNTPYHAQARFVCIVESYGETDSPFQNPEPVEGGSVWVN